MAPASQASSSSVQSASLLDRFSFPKPLALGYLGLLLFMVGDGIESGYLAPFLLTKGLSQGQVAVMFAVYGVAAAMAARFSGVLADVRGPRQVMWMGLISWGLFEIFFLIFGIPNANYPMMVVAYGLRGFGYQLFAYGFLVWIAATTSLKRLGSAVGWFWFAFTGGLPTLGSLLASFSVPHIGYYSTLWCSLVLVLIGGAIALFGVQEPTGKRRLAPPGENPL